MDKESNPPSFKSLLEQFELTKKELGDAEENIRRITGRDPDLFLGDGQGQSGPNKWKQQVGLAPSKPFVGRNKRPLFPIVKMKEEEEERLEEESPDEEIPTKRPSLSSTVVASPKDLKSRKETIQEQNINSKVKARNRRMFGMILGTLQKFQHDAKKRKAQDQKRAEIEKKIEAASAEEKERIKKEKEEWFQTRREKQTQLRCLEKKLEIAELHEVWEKNQKHMVHFIVTKTQPPITFLPTSHTPESSKLLKESKAKILESIQERREKMELELQEVEKWYQKDNFPSDKENIGPTEEELLESTEPADNSVGQNNEDTATQLEMEVPREGLEHTAEGVPKSPQTGQNVQESLENSQEMPVNEPENATSDEEMPRINNNEEEMEGKKPSDQDFEPIYD